MHMCTHMHVHMQVYAQTHAFSGFRYDLKTQPHKCILLFSSQLPPPESTVCFPCHRTLPDIALLKKQGYTFCLHRHVLLTIFWSDLFLVVKLRHVALSQADRPHRDLPLVDVVEGLLHHPGSDVLFLSVLVHCLEQGLQDTSCTQKPC